MWGSRMQGIRILKKAVVCLSFAGMLLAGAYFDQGQKVVPVGQQEEERQEELPPRIALTFDDGPHPVYTEKLLDGLKERGVKATFFVIGKNIQGNEEVLLRMAREGHVIGNHTWDHTDISSLRDGEACAELEKTNTLIEEIVGQKPAYVRPPFGKWKESLDCLVTMMPVSWTIDPLDWKTGEADRVVKRVVTKASDNDIILLHDYYLSSVGAALEIVDQLQREGFEFVTVEELLLE